MDEYDLRNEKIVSRVFRIRDILSSENLNVLNVHGHSHTQTGKHINSINVCIDNNKFDFIKLRDLDVQDF